MNIQAEVEPEIHLLACGSSSIEDQVALIGDRLTCLHELSKPVKTETGIEITDTLRFFTGDHPATQFEQGSKQGGNYKCGVCGCQDDQALPCSKVSSSLHSSSDASLKNSVHACT